ncbi:MAG: 2-hydroxychromene-2-carboxylate isomerase [Rubrivivax sp.]|nr:2-hydroxychromene-2-carboxylate isomerase [Rubrivivax sp.]
MKTLEFWFDPISPYAWLAFDALPDALEGLSYEVSYRPVLIAGLLAHWGQKGPAEIEPKRAWTYRDVLWRAHRQGLALELPLQHPFNPLPLLRLAVACAPTGQQPSRHVVETLFRHVWQGGGDAVDASRLTALQQQLKPVRDPASAEVKQELRENTEQAIAHQLFGVPSIQVDQKVFWGADALPALSEYLRGNPWFSGPDWDAAAAPRGGLRRS